MAPLPLQKLEQGAAAVQKHGWSIRKPGSYSKIY